jgi:hypothetical protein
MPCNSQYLEPTAQEIESRKVAKLILFLERRMKGQFRAVDPVRPMLAKTAKDPYGNTAIVHELTAALCGAIRALTFDEMDKHVWNGKVKTCRELADWWDAHKAHDRRRGKE